MFISGIAFHFTHCVAYNIMLKYVLCPRWESVAVVKYLM